MPYLYAEKWRSKITIETVRVFTGEAIMESFVKRLPSTKIKVLCNVWEVSETEEPRLLPLERLKELGLR